MHPMAQTGTQTNTQADIATRWLNQPSGTDSVKTMYYIVIRRNKNPAYDISLDTKVKNCLCEGIKEHFL